MNNIPINKIKFQIIAAELLSDYFKVEFRQEYPVAIGHPPKNHKFDLVSTDERYIGECKDYSWTTTGKTPSAKIAHINEAVLFLSQLAPDVTRFIAMRKTTYPSKRESLAEYYYRTYHHLLSGILVIELDIEQNNIKMVGLDND